MDTTSPNEAQNKAAAFIQLKQDLNDIKDGSSMNLPIEATAYVEADCIALRFTFLSQSYTAFDILTEKGYVLEQQPHDPQEYNVITFPTPQDNTLQNFLND